MKSANKMLAKVYKLLHRQKTSYKNAMHSSLGKKHSNSPIMNFAILYSEE